MRPRFNFFGIVLLFFVPFDIFSSDIEVPMRNQIPILQRLLSTENNLKKNKREIVAGVVYQGNIRASNQTKNEIFSVARSERLKIGEATLRFVPINIDTIQGSVYDALDDGEKYHLLIITQVRPANYKYISRYSAQRSVLTFATCADVMQRNKFSIAIGYKANSPQLYVNFHSLQAEGFAFPSQVLRHAKKLSE